jgi:hypothetical protein
MRHGASISHYLFLLSLLQPLRLRADSAFDTGSSFTEDVYHPARSWFTPICLLSILSHPHQGQEDAGRWIPILPTLAPPTLGAVPHEEVMPRMM